jgi:hypothetical protein
MDTITIPLEGFLGLELECFYYYEPAVQGDEINPPEPATLQLEQVKLGNGTLEFLRHLSSRQWQEIEQRIYDERGSEL